MLTKALHELQARIDACEDSAGVAAVLVQDAGAAVGADLTAWNVKDHELRLLGGMVWPAPGWNIGPLMPALDQFMPSHPLTLHLQRTNWRADPVRLSDHVGHARYRDSGLYRDVYRHLETCYQVVVPVARDEATITNLSFNRRGRDFSDAEMVWLARVQAMACRQMRRFAQWSTARLVMNQLSFLFQSAHDGMVRLDKTGRVCDAELAAARLLERFGGGPGGRALPAALRVWVEGLLQPLAGGVGVVERNVLEQTVLEDPGGRLLVTFFRDQFEDRTFLLLKAAPWREAGDGLPVTVPLSRREAEVLDWILHGKTNAECAIILGISRRTVDKHCEHVYAKLGVENRVGALRVAWECGVRR